MALPIFCDESIYLRYAQLIARAPIANALVSLVDPKPPLHYWLLAAVFGTTSDPLLAGRLLSVAAGLATLWILMPLCGELAALARPRRTRREASSAGVDPFPLAAGLLFLACPFLAFYQRMALAEALLVAQSLLVAWLALRLARDPSRGGLALGLALGLAFLTKQVFSYALAALPIAAAALRWRDLADAARRSLLRRVAAAFGLAALLFSPVLLVDYGPGLQDRVFFHVSHRYAAGAASHMARVVGDNLRYVFVPGILRETLPETLYEGFHAPADTGWLWIYLTPPVYLAALAGLAGLLARREKRLFAFLAVWIAATLVPFVGFATTAVSRYALFAVPPFLLAAASLAAWTAERVPRPIRVPVLAAILAALLAWPARSLTLQCADPARQPLARSDFWQYVSGWPAGGASRAAVAAIEAMAARGPVVVVTSRNAGTPDDVVWTYLDGRPNVFLYFVPWTFQAPILRPAGRPNSFILFAGFHGIRRPAREVTVRRDVPILFVATDPFPSPSGAIPASSSVLPRNREMREIARFENPSTPGIAHRDAVVLYRLR